MMKMAIREMCLSDFTIFSTTKCQVEMGRTVGIYKIMSNPREKFVLLTTSVTKKTRRFRPKLWTFRHFGQNHGRFGISAKNAGRFGQNVDRWIIFVFIGMTVYLYLYLYTIFDQRRLDIIDQVEHGRRPQQVTHLPPVWDLLLPLA